MVNGLEGDPRVWGRPDKRLHEAECWVMWTRVVTGEMERNGQILHIEEVRSVTSGVREKEVLG